MLALHSLQTPPVREHGNSFSFRNPQYIVERETERGGCLSATKTLGFLVFCRDEHESKNRFLYFAQLGQKRLYACLFRASRRPA